MHAALGSMMPFLISFLIHMGGWNYNEHFHSLLGNPAAAGFEFAGARFSDRQYVILIFTGVWAIIVTALNLPWFVRQMARFRPYDAASAVTLPIPSSDSSSATLPVSS